ncbi:MAG TPA: helix-turn-helix transcriptional regulator [Verrucomicrobiae bacterium]|nr:helix-turn-helix transcriptional regulator [Verrucomicrobiae bacterium]
MDANPIDTLLVSTAGVAAYPPGATFGPCLLYDFEFVWIQVGTAVARFGDKEIIARPGTVLLGRPGMMVHYDWDRERRTIGAFLHFSFDYSTPEWPPLREWPLMRQMKSDDILQPLFRYVIGMSEGTAPTSGLFLESAIKLMLSSFIAGRTTIASDTFEKLPAAVEKALVAVRRSLSTDPATPISLTELARAAAVSPEHLCRLFRHHLNLRPLECAGLARLERAASLLVRTNLASKEIAHTTGFVSPYHFSNKFKQVYGVSPREYRRAMRAGFTIAGNPIIQRLQLQTPTH